MIDKNIFRKTEAILYDYLQLEAEIRCLELEINNIKNNYEGCGAIGYEERTQSTNKFNSSVENEIINKEKEIKILLIELKYTNRNKLSWNQVSYILGFNVDMESYSSGKEGSLLNC